MKITIEVDDAEIRRVFGEPQMQPVFQSPPAETKLLTVKDVAERLAISRGKVYELLYSGQIKSLAIGRSRRVAPGALVEFISRPDPVSPVQLVMASHRSDATFVPNKDVPTPTPSIRRRRLKRQSTFRQRKCPVKARAEHSLKKSWRKPSRRWAPKAGQRM